jgi:hypothetical protein
MVQSEKTTLNFDKTHFMEFKTKSNPKLIMDITLTD